MCFAWAGTKVAFRVGIGFSEIIEDLTGVYLFHEF